MPPEFVSPPKNAVRQGDPFASLVVRQANACRLGRPIGRACGPLNPKQTAHRCAAPGGWRMVRGDSSRVKGG